MIGQFKDVSEKEGYHTFSVITGKDADEFYSAMSMKNIIAYMREFGITDSNEAIANITNKIKWMMNNKPSNEITVDTLEELKAYADKV